MALSIAEKSRRYRVAHPDRVRASGRRWAEANPDKVREKRRRRTERERGIPKKRNPLTLAAKKKRYALKHAAHLRTYNAQRSAERRAWLDSLKAAPCVDCGNRFPPCAMDFDHVRGEKVKCVGNLFNVSKERGLAEIAKCDLVCANCHRIRTAARRAATRQYSAA